MKKHLTHDSDYLSENGVEPIDKDDRSTVMEVSRKRRKLTQKDFAFLCGFHQSQISLIETARLRASISQMGRIANTLGVPIETLFYQDGEPRRVREDVR